MELDKTRIAVRERGTLEIFDLSLQVIRAYALPLVIAFAIGVVPLAVINHFLVGWMVKHFDFAVEFPIRYVWNMSVLVIFEAPLASIFLTAYLGKAVFHERPRVFEIVTDVLRLLPRILSCQLMMRGTGAIWLLLLLIDRTSRLNPSIEVVLFLAIMIFVLTVRAVRPFINEIIILERNPMRTRSNTTMTVGRRSALLHGPSSGQLFSRSFTSLLVALLLAFGVYGSLLFCSALFVHSWRQTSLMIQICLPLSLWIVAGFFAVVRFLSYLDLRIRQEGWEVELKLRAEAQRLASKLT